jgi:hypothetical protein
VLKLLDQNIFPTLVSIEQNGQEGTFKLMVSRSFYDVNPIHLVSTLFTGYLPANWLKTDRKILTAAQELDS